MEYTLIHSLLHNCITQIQTQRNNMHQPKPNTKLLNQLKTPLIIVHLLLAMHSLTNSAPFICIYIDGTQPSQMGSLSRTLLLAWVSL